MAPDSGTYGVCLHPGSMSVPKAHDLNADRCHTAASESAVSAHCSAKMAATSNTGSLTTGPVVVTSARRMVPLKGNGAV